MSSHVEVRPQNILCGVTLIVAAALTISIQAVVFKLFSRELTLWQIFALRGVLAVPMLIAVAWMRGAHKGVVRAAWGKWPVLRSLYHHDYISGFLCSYTISEFIYGWCSQLYCPPSGW